MRHKMNTPTGVTKQATHSKPKRKVVRRTTSSAYWQGFTDGIQFLAARTLK